MALYEALIRGNPDGTIKGASIEEWVAAGTNADGSPRYVPGDPRPATTEEMTAFVGAQYAQAAVQVASLAAERDALKAERAKQETQDAARRAAIDAMLPNVPDNLKAEIIALKGVPVFLATALLALLTADDMTHIASAIAAPDARTLYFELQQRAVTGDKPIPIDSQTFLAGVAVLKTALGEQRVAALFAVLNIDLVAGRYINP